MGAKKVRWNMVKAIRALSVLTFSTLFGAVIGFVTQILIARNLGPHDFGVFSGVMTVVSLLSPLCGFGVAQYWLKAFGEEGWAATRWIKPSFFLVGLLTLSITSSIFLWGVFGASDGTEKVFFMCLSFFIWGQVSVELLSGKLQLEEKYISLGFNQLFPHLFRFIIILSAIYLLPSNLHVVGVGISYLLTALAVLLACAGHFQKMYFGDFNLVGHGSRRENRFSNTKLKNLVQNALPFALAGVFHLIYFQGAVFFLAYLDSPKAAGLYNVAFVVMSAIYLIPGIIYQKYLLPKIHRWANHDRPMFYNSYKVGSLLMLAAGGGAAICIWALSEYMVPLIFGDQYIEAVVLLKWLSICAPLRFAATSVGAVLLTHSHMYKKVTYMGGVAVVSFFLNIILIPCLSVHGAVITAIASELFLLGLYYFAARRYVFKG